MPKSITQYDLLISCPGDIHSEIDLIEQAVADFNERFSDVLGISIRTRHWRKSSYAQSGDKPQALLNEQFVKECDAAVALLWTRFGTPTDKYGSGTEEEIEIMLDAGKQVFMYFSDRPVPPSKQEPAEYNRVKAFREKYKNRGLYAIYTSDEDFSKLFFAHLTQYFVTAKKIIELKNERVPKLFLRGINEEGKLCDNAPILPFKLNTECDYDGYIIKIRQLYQDIAGMHMGQRASDETDEFGGSLLASIAGAMSTFYPPVSVNEKQKELLTKVAKKLELGIPEDFFNLGNLSTNSLQSLSITGGKKLEGTDDEKLKYDLINLLYDTITACSKWAPIEKAFSGIKCIKLALENSGTAIDEDVEVTIIFNKEDFMPLSDFPKLENRSMNYLLNECEMEILFGISDTAQYMRYDSVNAVSHPVYSVDMPKFPLNSYESDYSDDYIHALQNVLGYTVYADGEKCILKWKFDYIKHHTTVAFPAAVFLKKYPAIIAYEIRSKNSADILAGHFNISAL